LSRVTRRKLGVVEVGDQWVHAGHADRAGKHRRGDPGLPASAVEQHAAEAFDETHAIDVSAPVDEPGVAAQITLVITCQEGDGTRSRIA
jgi:hypothetical protein